MGQSGRSLSTLTPGTKNYFREDWVGDLLGSDQLNGQIVITLKTFVPCSCSFYDFIKA